MDSPGQGALRVTRALGLALAAYGLSLAAHLVGGGHAPSVLSTAVLVLMTWWACLMVTYRRLGRPAMVAVVGLSQLLLHAGLSAASAARACSTANLAHGSHEGHPGLVLCSTSARVGATAAMSNHGRAGMAMTPAHVVAALLVGLVLARGEAAVWFLASLVWPASPMLVRPTAPTRWQPCLAEQVVATGVLPTGGVGRRGPPAGRVHATA